MCFKQFMSKICITIQNKLAFIFNSFSWRVFAGSHDLSLDEEPHRVVIETTEAVIHPDWNPLTIANDIALIKLPQKIEFNGMIF